METPKEVPQEVIDSFNKWKRWNRLSREGDQCPKLLFDNIMGCYYFTHSGIFYGIELNGYLHT